MKRKSVSKRNIVTPQALKAAVIQTYLIGHELGALGLTQFETQMGGPLDVLMKKHGVTDADLAEAVAATPFLVMKERAALRPKYQTMPR